MRDHKEFQEYIADTLARLPGVSAVALGGSRAYGNPGPETDWDFSIYYRGAFDPEDLRALGWPGEVSPIGGWGGGVFNGGAWFTVEGRRVDIHYRELDVIDRIQRDAFDGTFQIEPLLFHLAGIPSYLLLAELAEGICLRGHLPLAVYPSALREQASRQWWSRADMLFQYAGDGHAAHGRILQAIGMTAEAVTCAAHAILAAKGQWVTNEKRILALSGLDAIDRSLGSSPLSSPGNLLRVVHQARDACERMYADAGRDVSP